MSFGVIAASVAVAGTAISYNQGRKAVKSQRAANDAQLRINRLRNKQQHRLFMANVRKQIAEGIVGNIAALGGGYESSRGYGTTASELTQRDVAVNEYEILDNLGAEYIGHMNTASRRGFQSQVWGQIGSFAGQMGGYSQIKDWVTPKTPSKSGSPT